MEHNHEHGGMMKGAVCNCSHHKLKPVIISLFGLLFLLHHAWGVFTPMFVSVAWPTLILAFGLSKMGSCKCC